MRSEPTRLNKYIAESGVCSRREADRHIEQGRVFINGQKAKIGDQVLPGDRVMINGHTLEPREEDNLIFLAFNKPVGITSTTEPGVKSNIVDYVNHSERVFPIGRLDKDSQGLIFLTNNGDIVNKILRAGNHHEKEYLVTVNKPVTEAFISGMAGGVPILGETTKKCKVKKEGPQAFNIILIQGMNRQIRRMCEYFGYEVTKLERIRIMNISLRGLPVGEWRDLEADEMAGIMKALEHSSSTVRPKQGKKTEHRPAQKEAPGKDHRGSSKPLHKGKPASAKAKPARGNDKNRVKKTDSRSAKPKSGRNSRSAKR